MLERRAELGEVSPLLKIDEPVQERPHASHESRRVGLGFGWGEKEDFVQTVEGRVTLHDLADPATGYPALAQWEGFSLRLRYQQAKHRLLLEDATLLRLGNYGPVNSFDPHIAWHFELGGTSLDEPACDGGLAGKVAAGSGATLSFFEGKFNFILLADFVFLTAVGLEGGLADTPVRLGLGPSSIIQIKWRPDIITLLSGSWTWLPTQEPWQVWEGKAVLRARLGKTQTALNFEGQYRRFGRAAGLAGVLVYF